MIYQLFSIRALKRQEAELESKIAEYELLIDNAEDTLEARQMRWWIERRARELGYVYVGDVTLD
jgi:hypothetical protein